MTKSGIASSAALVCLVAGCGSGSGSKPQDVATTYLKAFADGDGTKACGQLTGDAKRQAVDYVSSQLPELNASDCETALSKISKQLGEDEKANLRGAKVKKTTTTGNSATVAFSGATSDAQLTKTAGGWLISGGLFDGSGGLAAPVGTDTAPSEPTPSDTSPLSGEGSLKTLRRVLKDYSDLGYIKSVQVEDAIAIQVKDGTSKKQAQDLCDFATGAIAGTNISQMAVINQSGNDVATCLP